MATTSRGQPENSRRYQGYPFVNPVVIDVPTLDAATAAKWTNLPRKPIANPVQQNAGRSPRNDTTANDAGSSGSQPGSSRGNESEKKEDIPVVYIDLPDELENSGDAISNSQIDRGQENLAYIQDTIFFDPFENRQINLNKPREAQTPGDSPGPSTPGSSVNRPPNHRPNRLDLSSPGVPSLAVPGFMNKESQVYGSSPEDGFTLTPLPVADYPEPPPAYSEVAGSTSTQQPTQPAITTPPRTVVVVPDQSPTVGLPSSNRKLAECQNCRLRVHTVVVKENGVFTHIVAIITIILCLLPLTIAIYCTDFFKYQVHFCPNCNHRIGYEIPILCQSMVYN